MNVKIETGHIVAYKNTADYFLYEVVGINGQSAQLKPINEGMEHNQSICALRHADSTEKQQGFRVPNPSNFTANDKMYFNSGYKA